MTARKAARIWPGPDTAPFRKGNLMEWVNPHDVAQQTANDSWGSPDEWRPNVPFRAALTLTGTERGRSAARFTWRAENGDWYPMFMTDACALMLRGEALDKGVRDGWWIVMKRGQNYGIAAIAPHIAETGVPACPVNGQGCSTCRVGGGNGTGGVCARQGEIGESSAAAPPAPLAPTVDLDRELVRACRERATPDGLITATQAARSFNLRTRPWIGERFKAAFHGQKPLPGVALSRVIGEGDTPGTWRLTFARHCNTCDLWVPDWMRHPHPLEPAIWEAGAVSEIAELTERVWANKIRQGFNVTDVPYEFMLTNAEIAEAFEAWRKGDDVAPELADVALFVMSLARMLNVDLAAAIREKMTVNEARAYVTGPTGVKIKAEL